MSGLSIQQPQARPQPRSPLYVSRANGSIHQAMSSPSGYEDEHPEDWRPATYAEREQYAAGADRVLADHEIQELPYVQQQSVATPQSLTMAPDEPAVEIQQVPTTVQPAPVVVAAAIPPAPATPFAAPPAAPTE